MELHTLGVDGGYTQDDVAELSRVLTGWTIDGQRRVRVQPGDSRLGAEDGARRDDPRRLAVAGTGGHQGRRADARPPRESSEHRDVHRDEDAQVAAHAESDRRADRAIASVYRATGGDIKAMIRAILNDAWLPAAPMKLKRPFHFLASVDSRRRIRRSRRRRSINSQLNNLGHPLFSGTRRTASRTRSSTGRATSCRGGRSRIVAVEPELGDDASRSTRRRTAPARPTPRSI